MNDVEGVILFFNTNAIMRTLLKKSSYVPRARGFRPRPLGQKSYYCVSHDRSPGPRLSDACSPADPTLWSA
jgi:hypothetical protein